MKATRVTSSLIDSSFFSFQSSGIGEPSVYHALIVIFLEFFAWGLLTMPIINVSQLISINNNNGANYLCRTLNPSCFLGAESNVSKSHIFDERTRYGHQRNSIISECATRGRPVRRVGKKIFSTSHGFLYMCSDPTHVY